MKTFKNKNFTKRDYETTNVIFCTSEKAPNDSWIECGENEIGNCRLLWKIGDVFYYGYL